MKQSKAKQKTKELHTHTQGRKGEIRIGRILLFRFWEHSFFFVNFINYNGVWLLSKIITDIHKL